MRTELSNVERHRMDAALGSLRGHRRSVSCSTWLVAFLCACSNSGNGAGVGGSTVTPSDTIAPLFTGVRSVATAGGDAVSLAWDAGQDETTPEADLRYQVFLATASGAQDFSQPLVTTSPGATSVIVTGADSAAVAVGQRGYYVVRAVDGANNADANAVEVAVSPVDPSDVAFVSDAAVGAGALGDSSAPYATIQAAVNAVVGAGGGAVVVDADAGGTSYPGEVDVAASGMEISLFGGFARFAGLAPSATGADVLASRDTSAHQTVLTGVGLSVIADDDLVRIDNAGGKTCVDGFSFAGELPYTLSPLSGTLEGDSSSSYEIYVSGTGTLFESELIVGDLVQYDSEGILREVISIFDDDYMTLGRTVQTTISIPSGPGSVASRPAAVRVANGDMQLSGCTLSDGNTLASETPAQTSGSELQIVGNRALGSARRAFQVAGGYRKLRVQNNRLPDNVHWALGAVSPAARSLYVQPAGTDVLITHNLAGGRIFAAGDVNEQPNADLEGCWALAFAAADPAVGGALSVTISDNEVRDHAGAAIWLRDIYDFGPGGSLALNVERNLFNGGTANAIAVTSDGEPQSRPYETAASLAVGGDVAIRFVDNDILNFDEYPLYVELQVAPGGTTEVEMTGCNITCCDNEPLFWTRAGLAPDACNGGDLAVRIERNVSFGAATGVRVAAGVAHGGATLIDVCHNTLVGAYDDGYQLLQLPYLSTTTQPVTFPDGLFTVRAFNNFISGEDPLRTWVGDSQYNNLTVEDGASMTVVYAGHNTMRALGDGGNGAIDLALESSMTGALVERNFLGGAGQDSSESGFSYEVTTSAVTQTRVLNNVAAFSSGGGFAIQSDGPAPQLINNTAAYNGSQNSDQAGIENASGVSDFPSDVQVYVLNCVATHNGADDIDADRGVRPYYSLIRDQSTPTGLGNLGGEPFYLYGLESLTGLGQAGTAEIYSDLFRTRNSSAAINAGHPDPFWNDRDGSRNDMGAFGGPNAGPIGATFDGMAMPLVYVATFPSPHLYTGRALISSTETLRFAFSRAVDPASVIAGIRVRDGGADVAGNFALEGDGRVVSFTPATILTPNGGAFVDVAFTAALAAADGQPLGYAWRERIAVRPLWASAEVEPNDDGVAGLSAADFASAQPITAGPGPWVVEIQSSVASTDDYDVYAVVAQAGDRIQATTLDARLPGGGVDGAIRLDLHSSIAQLTEGNVGCFLPNNGVAVNGDAFLDHTFAEAGTYYLVVSNPDAAATPQTYHLLTVLDR